MAPLQQSKHGSSGSFLVLADDRNRYWCKTLNNLQSPRVPTKLTTATCARCGTRIDLDALVVEGAEWTFVR